MKRCPLCGGAMVQTGIRTVRCPKCNPKPEVYIAGRPTECPLCEVPLGPGYTCPTCDHSYREHAVSRFVLPSRVRSEGTLLGECRTRAGTQEIWAYEELFIRMDLFDENLTRISRRAKPWELNRDKALAYLRSMAGHGTDAFGGHNPKDCTVTHDGLAMIRGARTTAPKPPRSCKCMTVAKAKAGKRRR